MVKLNKSPLPDSVEIKCEQDYRSDPIFSLIRNDCHNKCYICEEKEPTGLQVEHRIAHHGNDMLKYDWNNLLLACYHCNHTKSDKHNSILDCTQVDPEEYITISMMPILKEKVSVEVIQDTPEARATANLLDIIYNGERTAMLNAECENLRNRVMKELVNLQQKLIEYEEEPDVEIRQGFQHSIAKMIARSSTFAAFKRKIIRDNLTYMQEFGGYLA